MTRYRIRIYRSPRRELVHVRMFTANNDYDARATAGTIISYVRHRKRISEYSTSWALDALRVEPIGWHTVATS